MRRFLILSLLTVVPDVTSATNSYSITKFHVGNCFKFKDFYNQINNQEFEADVLVGTKHNKLKEIISQILERQFLEALFLNKNYLSEECDSILWSRTLGTSASASDWKLDLEDSIFLSRCQVWDLATETKIQFSDLEKKLKVPNFFAIKLKILMTNETTIYITFNCNVVEKTTDELKTLIDSCDYYHNGFFKWFFMLKNFKEIAHMALLLINFKRFLKIF